MREGVEADHHPHFMDKKLDKEHETEVYRVTFTVNDPPPPYDTPFYIALYFDPDDFLGVA